MRFSLGLPTDRVQLGDEFGTGEAVMEMARAAEAGGYDAVSVTEHPIPEDAWMASGGHHAFDPFVALAFAAAATSRLRLQTNLCVVPYRNPFLTAKAVASLDRLSGGRLIFGAGAGYLEPEFRALGVDYARRNELFDEALQVMRQVFTGESISLSGEGWEARGHHALPRPVQLPGPPVWIGGNSRRAIRRAVELGDGWLPIFNQRKHVARRSTPAIESHEDLAARLDYMRQHAARTGHPEPRDVCYMAVGGGICGGDSFDAAATIDEIGRLAELGVTQISASVAAESRSAFLDNAAAYSEAVVRKLA